MPTRELGRGEALTIRERYPLTVPSPSELLPQPISFSFSSAEGHQLRLFLSPIPWGQNYAVCPCSTVVVLNPWATAWPHLSCAAHQIFTSQLITVDDLLIHSNENILWLGSTTAGGTVLRSPDVRKVGKYPSTGWPAYSTLSPECATAIARSLF